LLTSTVTRDSVVPLFFSFFFYLLPLLLSSPLFPYTTLFRSLGPAPDGVKGRLAHWDASRNASGEIELRRFRACGRPQARKRRSRSEEHTSELQSLRHLVCRLLLEKKKKK